MMGYERDQRSSTPRPSPTGRAGWCLLVVTMSGHLCWADPAASISTHQSGPQIALNQAVSIESGRALTAIADSTGRPSMTAEDSSRDAQVAQEASLSMIAPRRGASDDRLARLGEPAVGERTAGFSAADLWPLAIVLVLIGAVAWAIKRWVPAVRARESGVLQVSARADITPKHSLALVRVGQRFVMVGIGGDRISTLCEVNDPDEVAALLMQTERGGGVSQQRFEETLSCESGAYADEGKRILAAPASRLPTPASLKHLLSRLRAARCD